MSRSNSNKSDSKKSNDSASSSPDITSRGPLNLNKTNGNTANNNNNNNHRGNNVNNSNNNGPMIATMSETSDDSSLNSVELDPMGKNQFSDYRFIAYVFEYKK